MNEERKLRGTLDSNIAVLLCAFDGGERLTLELGKALPPGSPLVIHAALAERIVVLHGRTIACRKSGESFHLIVRLVSLKREDKEALAGALSR